MMHAIHSILYDSRHVTYMARRSIRTIPAIPHISQRTRCAMINVAGCRLPQHAKAAGPSVTQVQQETIGLAWLATHDSITESWW